MSMSFDFFLAGRASPATMESLTKAEPLDLSSGVSLCSRRDPRGEASRQVGAWLERLGGRIPSPRFLVVLGFAGGWHLEELSRLLVAGDSVFVADPHPAAFLAGVSDFDFSNLSASGVDFHFSVLESPADIAAELEEVLDRKGVCLPSLFAHPGALRAFPGRYAALSAELASLSRRRFLDVRTVGAFSSEWLLNAIDNLPLSLGCARVDGLKGVNAGRPALVVGAGPSLDKSLDWIAEASGKVMTICVGTALKSLLAKGIVPDFVVVVDSDPRIARQFEGVDPALPFRLLAAPHVQPSLLRRFKGGLTLFSTSLLPGMNALLEACGALPASLKTGGTVALTAVELARFAGSSEIVLAGLDLAMAPDGRSHSSSSVYDGQRLERKGLVAIPGNLGGNVLTTPQFAHYVELFDKYLPELSSEGIKVWNASFGGALLKGAAMAGPVVLDALAGRGGASSKPCLSECCVPPPAPSGAKGKLEEVAASLARLSANAASILSLYGRAKGEGLSGAILAEMERLDKEINSDNLALGLCGDALKALALGIPAGASKEDAISLGMTMYEALAKASELLSRRLPEDCSLKTGSLSGNQH